MFCAILCVSLVGAFVVFGGGNRVTTDSYINDPNNSTSKAIDKITSNVLEPNLIATKVVNDAPKYTSTPLTKAIAGQLYTYDVNATDPDAGDILTPTNLVYIKFVY